MLLRPGQLNICRWLPRQSLLGQGGAKCGQMGKGGEILRPPGGGLGLDDVVEVGERMVTPKARRV